MTAPDGSRGMFPAPQQELRRPQVAASPEEAPGHAPSSPAAPRSLAPAQQPGPGHREGCQPACTQHSLGLPTPHPYELPQLGSPLPGCSVHLALNVLLHPFLPPSPHSLLPTSTPSLSTHRFSLSGPSLGCPHCLGQDCHVKCQDGGAEGAPVSWGTFRVSPVLGAPIEILSLSCLLLRD